MENVKIKWNWFVFLLLVVTTLGCNTFGKKSTLLFTATDKNAILTLYNVVEDVADTLIVDDQLIIYDTDFPLILFANNGVKDFYIYLEEGSQLLIFDKAGEVSFFGETGFENQTLQHFDSVLKKKIDKMGYNALYRLSYPEFETEVEARLKELNKIWSQLPSIGFGDLRTLLYDRIDAIKKLYYLEYQDNYELLVGTPAYIPDSVKAKLIDLSNFNNAGYLNFEEGRLYIKFLFTKFLKQEYDTGDYYLNLFSYASDVIINKKVSAYLQYSFLREHLHFSDSIQVDYIHGFISSSDNQIMNKKLSAILQDLQRLAKGEEAPYFEGKSADGIKYNLKDFKGKWIYLDLWAMWCIPCYREFPYFRDLAAGYGSDKIIFIGLSVDDSNEFERWKIFIIEKELGGIQLFSEEGWQSEIVINYKIENIPRYILIDPNGKIFDADAPWASDRGISDILENVQVNN